MDYGIYWNLVICIFFVIWWKFVWYVSICIDVFVDIVWDVSFEGRKREIRWRKVMYCLVIIVVVCGVVVILLGIWLFFFILRVFVFWVWI